MNNVERCCDPMHKIVEVVHIHLFFKQVFRSLAGAVLLIFFGS